MRPTGMMARRLLRGRVRSAGHGEGGAKVSSTFRPANEVQHDEPTQRTGFEVDSTLYGDGDSTY